MIRKAIIVVLTLAAVGTLGLIINGEPNRYHFWEIKSQHRVGYRNTGQYLILIYLKVGYGTSLGHRWVPSAAFLCG